MLHSKKCSFQYIYFIIHIFYIFLEWQTNYIYIYIYIYIWHKSIASSHDGYIQFYCIQWLIYKENWKFFSPHLFPSLIKIFNDTSSLKVVAFPFYLNHSNVSSCPTLVVAHHFLVLFSISFYYSPFPVVAMRREDVLYITSRCIVT